MHIPSLAELPVKRKTCELRCMLASQQATESPRMLTGVWRIALTKVFLSMGAVVLKWSLQYLLHPLLSPSLPRGGLHSSTLHATVS